MRHKYDTLVSIGWNCEVSFRIQDYINHGIDSYMYSWVRVQTGEGLLHSLYHPEDVLSGEIRLLECGMLRCENCQMDFHGIGEKGRLFLEDGSPNEQVLADTVKELRSRIGHTSEKFQKLLVSDKKSLFIWKLNENFKIDEDVLYNIGKVYQFLKERYLSGKFALMIIVEKDKVSHRLLELQQENLFVKEIKRAADKENVLLDGDIDGWMKILAGVDIEASILIKHLFVQYLKLRWRFIRWYKKTYLGVENMLVVVYHKIRGVGDGK